MILNGPLNRFIRLWLPVVLYAALIFVLSALPEARIPTQISNFDKFFHLLEYLFFGILIARGIKGTYPSVNLKRIYFLVAVITLLYGISDEFHQFFVPGRTVSLWDAVSDGIGGFIGALFIR
jgi:VanZ family protein